MSSTGQLTVASRIARVATSGAPAKPAIAADEGEARRAMHPVGQRHAE